MVVYFIAEKAVGSSRIAVHQRVQRLASRAEPTHRITPHGLRATGAGWIQPHGTDGAFRLERDQNRSALHQGYRRQRHAGYGAVRGERDITAVDTLGDLVAPTFSKHSAEVSLNAAKLNSHHN
jgi:hypothetical protein